MEFFEGSSQNYIKMTTLIGISNYDYSNTFLFQALFFHATLTFTFLSNLLPILTIGGRNPRFEIFKCTWNRAHVRVGHPLDHQNLVHIV